LLTEDKDFGDLVFRRGQPVPAVVLLRGSPSMHELKKGRLAAAIDRFGESLRGRYTVVEESKIRARFLPK
jgi:predicted nuclease of predicted toxin-antitoxin system